MLRPSFLLLLSFLELVRSSQVEEAVCRLASGLQGEIRLRAGAADHQVQFSGQITGLSQGKHGFHVHEVRQNCED